MKANLFGACLVAALAAAPVAHAQSAAVAEGLYRQARDLMAAGKYDEACPKFAESQRLDPATGTLLNLAACHEKQGKLASAWIEYSDALIAARRDGREDRVEYARQRSAELEPQLSRLTLQLDANADAAGLTLALDGAAIGRAVIGAAMPVDPGTHTVTANAPGKKSWTQSIEIGKVADQKTLNIPSLEDAPPEPVAPPAAAGPPPVQLLPAPSHEDAGARPIPTSVYLMGGVTVALGIGAGITGVAYLNKKAAYEDERDAGPSSDLKDQQRTAKTYGYLNLGLWAATALGAGVTTYLYVTRPTAQASARLTPWAGPQGGGLTVSGGF
jgi:tetratricopeptide (TPR) repeat protein